MCFNSCKNLPLPNKVTCTELAFQECTLNESDSQPCTAKSLVMRHTPLIKPRDFLLGSSVERCALNLEYPWGAIQYLENVYVAGNRCYSTAPSTPIEAVPGARISFAEGLPSDLLYTLSNFNLVECSLTQGRVIPLKVPSRLVLTTPFTRALAPHVFRPGLKTLECRNGIENIDIFDVKPLNIHLILRNTQLDRTRAIPVHALTLANCNYPLELQKDYLAHPRCQLFGMHYAKDPRWTNFDWMDTNDRCFLANLAEPVGCDVIVNLRSPLVSTMIKAIRKREHPVVIRLAPVGTPEEVKMLLSRIGYPPYLKDVKVWLEAYEDIVKQYKANRPVERQKFLTLCMSNYHLQHLRLPVEVMRIIGEYML